MMSGGYHYLAYGLRIRSEIPVPLAPDPAAGEPDVTVAIGAVPEAPATPAGQRGVWRSAPGVFLLTMDGVARYRAREGTTITVEPTGGGAAAVSAFLLGSAMAACLQQRGIVPLHASAIVNGAREGVLFAGVSGSGKSTLLAALVERGYAMLADDVTGIFLDADGRPTALSAVPRLRLWADAVDKLGWQSRTRGRVHDGQHKFLVPVERFRTEPLAVGGVFALGLHKRQGLEIESLPPVRAFELLLEHTYRSEFLSGLGRQREHFRTVAGLARQVPVARVKRPAHPFLLDALADEIERRLEAIRPAGPAGRRAADAAASTDPATFRRMRT